MLEVERQKSNTLQAEVLRRGAENLQPSQKLNRSKEEVRQLQSPYNKFRRHHALTQRARDEGDVSQELESMHLEDNTPGS